MEIVLTNKLTSFKDILLMQEKITKKLKKIRPAINRVMIDFYSFLRKE